MGRVHDTGQIDFAGSGIGVGGCSTGLPFGFMALLGVLSLCGEQTGFSGGIFRGHDPNSGV